MKLDIIQFSYEDKIYPVYITRKFMKYTRYRFKKDGFYVSCPFLVTNKEILKGLEKYAPKLLLSNIEKPIGDDYIYLLGNKISITFPGNIKFSDGTSITFNDLSDLKNKTRKWFLNLLKIRTQYYEKVMNISANNVRVRDVSSRYGSNSRKTNSITYALILMHYSIEIIDAIIVHELAHCYVLNHSKNFYDIVLKYYPNYKVAHNKLRKGLYK